MTEQPAAPPVPEWDRADRLRKALRESDTGVSEMADYLGVSRNTVSNWINGRIEPSLQTFRLWAIRTGVDYAWLVTGDPGTALESIVRKRRLLELIILTRREA